MMYRILIAVYFFAFVNITAYACSCNVPNRPFNDVIKNSEIVFLGTPIETKLANPTDCKTVDTSNLRPDLKEPIIVCDRTRITSFRVATPIKGDIGATFDVHHGIEGSSCGVQFRPNELTFIHTNANGGKYRTSLCSRTVHKLETFQAYAETSPEERNCIEQISEVFKTLPEPQVIKDTLKAGGVYSLSLLNLDPVCEAYWPIYQRIFGTRMEKALHSIVSESRNPVRIEPEITREKDVNAPARSGFKYLASLLLLTLAGLVVVFLMRLSAKSP